MIIDTGKLKQDTIQMFVSEKIHTPELDTTLLMIEAFSISQVDILLGKKITVSANCLEHFNRLVAKRLQHIPISHILYQKEFMSLDFYLEPGYFTPRPDTELLVTTTLDLISKNYPKKSIKILDYCAGTGAIGISIGYYASHTNIFAYDIAMSAPAFPRKAQDFVGDKDIKPFLLPQVNAVKMNLENRFTPLTKEDLPSLDSVHILVSNPPYIPTKDLVDLEKSVLNEPILALDGGIDGLDVYREILSYAEKHLISGGYILFEIGYHQKNDLFTLLEANKYVHIQSFTDLNQLDRVILAQKQ